MAAQREVEAVQAAYDTGKITLDVLLQAQRTLADAESNYYRTLVSYNESIAEVHLRKGSLLEYNGVYLAEGPWPGKAYFDARRRARSRDAAHYLNYGFTQPGVISRGPVNQWADSGANGGPAAAGQAPPEQVPTPAPLPAADGIIPPAPTAHEPVANPSPAATDRSAAGWQGLQY